MKISRTFTLVILVITGTFYGCKNDPEDYINSNLPPHTMIVSNIQGVIGYWKHNDINKFTINVAVPGTIDSQITGIVNDLPSEFKNEGMIVIFSGKYKEEGTNPEPIFGGQMIYSLTLSSIRKK